jgi:hypothetical protein
MILTIYTTQPPPTPTKLALPNQYFCWGKFWHFFDLKFFDFNMNKRVFVKEMVLICQTLRVRVGGGDSKLPNFYNKFQSACFLGDFLPLGD